VIEVCTLDTVVGPLTLVGDGAALVAAGFAPAGTMVARLSDTQRNQTRLRSELGHLSRSVSAYLDGRLDALDDLPVNQPGTAHQQEVWSALRATPAGQTLTYTELAAATSRPAAIRAAGTACGRNLVAPIVPCHRALRRDGSLGGYWYGLDVKRWLLAHEARAAGSPPPR
jgi:methylated-DNA-[protein]-cysteine S-methyltransferase